MVTPKALAGTPAGSVGSTRVAVPAASGRKSPAGTGAFPFETVTNDCDPKVVPTTQIFNNNLHVFAQKTSGDVVWGVAPHGGKWDVKVLGN